MPASRLRLVQVLSAGYDRVNIAGARAARIPICSNGGANSVAGGAYDNAHSGGIP